MFRPDPTHLPIHQAPTDGTISIQIVSNYEVLRLLDTWLRQDFVPAQPPNVHMILCGREAPLAAWLCTPGWAGLFRSIAIEPLAESAAVELLARSGISESRAHHINRFTRGHPLALTLAAATLAESDSPILEDLALHRVIEELARMYLDEISDEITRRALEAASVVRCATVSLFRAMLPEAAPQDAYERVRSIPFVQMQREGLQVHDCLQQAIALGLKAADPSRYLRYRRAAWRQLRKEVRSAPASELWRYTADMLYQLQNPIVREAFFPTGAHTFGVEPARPDDANSVFDIVRHWEGPEAMRCLELWWKHAPHSFHVVREPEGKLAGFSCVLDPESVTPELEEADPIVRNWMEHLKVSPVPAMQCALFSRGLLSRESGEGPCGVQGAFWLDVKRTYMLLRPRLRRVYCHGEGRCFSDLCSGPRRTGFSGRSPAPIRRWTANSIGRRCWTLDLPRLTGGWVDWLPRNWVATAPSCWTLKHANSSSRDNAFR